MLRSLGEWLHDLAVTAVELHRRTARARRRQWCHCGAPATSWYQCNPCRHRFHTTCWCSIRPSLAEDLNG